MPQQLDPGIILSMPRPEGIGGIANTIAQGITGTTELLAQREKARQVRDAKIQEAKELATWQKALELSVDPETGVPDYDKALASIASHVHPDTLFGLTKAVDAHRTSAADGVLKQQAVTLGKFKIAQSLIDSASPETWGTVAPALKTVDAQLFKDMPMEWDDSIPVMLEHWKGIGADFKERLQAQNDAVKRQIDLAKEGRDSQDFKTKTMANLVTYLANGSMETRKQDLIGAKTIFGATDEMIAAVKDKTPDELKAAAIGPTKMAELAGKTADDQRMAAAAAEAARHNRAMEQKEPTGATSPVAIMGPDGKPVFVAPKDAYGQRPANVREVGRPVTSGDANRIADIDTSFDELGTLRKELGEMAGTTGTSAYLGSKVPQPLTDMFGWGADAKKKQATIQTVKQIVGKALEGGVLRLEDEKKYEKILPIISDTAEVVKSKLDGLDRLMKNKRDNLIDNLDDAGYDVTKFRDRQPTSVAAPATNDAPPAQLTKPGVQPGVYTVNGVRWMVVPGGSAPIMVDANNKPIIK